MNSFKDRLKQIMSERKISQSELSRRTGIGRNSISDYLNGKYEAKQDKVFELAKALNVNEAWLMGFDISKNRKIENNDITSIYNKLTPPRQENVLNYANEQLDEQNKTDNMKTVMDQPRTERTNGQINRRFKQFA
uniref:helix-turn-helix domain-containing protein n=1 Tax=Staphylococcus aureus TaxID=1280 RepID=UPI00243426FD